MEKLEILKDLAAVFRWTARLNMHEGIANHFSVCLPDSNGSFYLPFTSGGMFRAFDDGTGEQAMIWK